jgi:predicted sulfurtransferase
MKNPRLPLGHSDPVSYTCTCSCSATFPPTPGLVLLFYRYFSAPPILPSPSPSPSPYSLSSLHAFHETLTRTLSLGGKIRIGKEGFNVTVAGTRHAIETYMEACLNHWSFAGLDLRSEESRREFFKPSPGCGCVFGGEGMVSVRIKGEITPMGVTDYEPLDWSVVRRVRPGEFHEMLETGGGRGKSVLLDVRNHYESRIGYFVDGEGREAVRPGIRRFAQWPGFVRRWVDGDGAGMEGVDGNDEEMGKQGGRKIMAYCTGGIRCEKATRWMLENAKMKPRDEVYTLEGGIQAYLMWMEEEIRAGRKTTKDSLFKGKNYVFDARGSLGLDAGHEGDEELEPVAECHVCGQPEDRLSKCRSRGCHLVLVVCERCEEGDVRCCENCRELDREGSTEGPRPICLCEIEREARLWGEEYFRKSKMKGMRKGGKEEGIMIELKAIA